jgi:hypothetical protein
MHLVPIQEWTIVMVMTVAVVMVPPVVPMVGAVSMAMLGFAHAAVGAGR